ncbi:MAG: glycosyltransferase [candidate division WOR-3 bacterium]
MDKFSLIVPVYFDTFEEQIKSYLKEDIGEVIVVLTQDREFDLKDERIKVLKLFGAGYGQAINYASKFSKNEYLIITNDDIYFDENFFKKVKNIQNDVVVPLVKNFYTQNIESFGSKIVLFYNILNKDLKYDKRNLHLTGSFFIIKKEIFERLKGFDESYFMYYEDVDLSVRLKKIEKICFDENLVVYHKHSSSGLKCKRFLLQRNRLFFVFKNFDSKNIFLFLLFLIFIEPVIMILQVFKQKNFSPIIARYEFLRNLKKIMRERNENPC